ncbi:MAG TPA: signal peptidase I [Syntrophorhabdales bacterium]|nr:signal peptidase I [Syntrophorhabdales bacterium]
MREKSKIRQFAETIAIAALLAIFVRSFVVEAFTIPSGSMEPTLLVGDYLLANRLSYVVKVPFTDVVLIRLGEPKRGDIVIFRYPLDPSKDYVKRIVAKGGDTVEIRDKVVYVNGQKVEEGYAHFTDHTDIPGSQLPRDNFGPVKVPKDCYFAMGDNRDNSSDSRFWGFLKEGDLVGKAEIIYFSLDSDAESFLASVRWQRLGHMVR